MPNNLQNLDYPEKSDVQNIIAELSNVKDEAYLLSVVLIANALQGDEKAYRNLLNKIQKALDKMADSAFKAWILGRILLAADCMNDNKTIDDVKKQLIEEIDLAEISTMKIESDYAMYVWACGYLAGLNKDHYKERKNNLMNYLVVLNKAAANSANHELLSNAVWAQIMALQAAAKANDNENYKSILNQMMNLTQKKSVSEALEKALTWTNESSDYRAWGMSLVYSAAVKMKDVPLYQELKKPLIAAIQEAKERDTQKNLDNQWKTRAEAVLGLLNYVLTENEAQQSLETSFNSLSVNTQDVLMTDAPIESTGYQFQ